MCAVYSVQGGRQVQGVHCIVYKVRGKYKVCSVQGGRQRGNIHRLCCLLQAAGGRLSFGGGPTEAHTPAPVSEREMYTC